MVTNEPNRSKSMLCDIMVTPHQRIAELTLQGLGAYQNGQAFKYGTNFNERIVTINR